MKNTIYVIGTGEAKTIFDQEFALYQQEQGHYFDIGFDNWGAVRYSLDGTQVLLEEEESKFLPEHLARQDVQIFTQEEVKNYLLLNKTDWEEEEELV